MGSLDGGVGFENLVLKVMVGSELRLVERRVDVWKFVSLMGSKVLMFCDVL